jgi:CBS domain-containing protein
MLTVQDIMTTDVVTVSPSATLREAAELFSRRHIGGAPVVDGQQVVGVVSASDILTFAPATPPARADAASFFAERWAYSEHDAADDFGESSGRRAVALDGHTVSEVMTQDILSLAPSTDVSVAAERMRASDVHRLLVMRDGVLVGILSTTDLARAIADRRVPVPARAAGRSR